MSAPAIETTLEFAVDLARRAGKTTLDHFQSGLQVEKKPDGSPVTAADRSAEQLIRDAIEARFPSDGVVGEEYGTVRPEADRRWIVDPIDGTRSFVRGVPLYGVLIALEERGDAILGVLHFPALDGETVFAAKGSGCWWNGTRCGVSEVSDVGAALVLTTDLERLGDRYREGWRALRRAAAFARTWGDCYGHALVATGRAEAMVDPKMSVWDAAALKPIVEEAGGVFTDWSGRRTHDGGSAVSTNAALADVARSLLGAGAF